MALQLDYTNALSINYPTAYARVHEYFGNKDNIKFEVCVYTNATSYTNGEREIDRLNFEFPYVDGMTLSDAYNALKTLPAFTDAVDV